jgi:hypothetical protein
MDKNSRPTKLIIISLSMKRVQSINTKQNKLMQRRLMKLMKVMQSNKNIPAQKPLTITTSLLVNTES